MNSKNEGLDGVIPRIVLENAKAFAIFTVVKAGFIVTARAGSGIVIARVEDGSTRLRVCTAMSGFLNRNLTHIRSMVCTKCYWNCGTWGWRAGGC